MTLKIGFIKQFLTKTKKCQFKNVFVLSCLALVAGIILATQPFLVNKYWNRVPSNTLHDKLKSSPQFAIYSKSHTEEHLVHIVNILHRLGFERTSIDGDWDLLWAHDYPFLKMSLKNLREHQVVNHFPGCGFITNKVDLCTTELPFLPRAFRLPTQSTEFESYAKNHPKTRFVVKHNEHRHIEIRTLEEINLNSTNSFVQEYISNPYLIDGYKFDIGVYVVITSVNPLRVYIYTGDVLFRYCSVKYYPFDERVIDKYVVGDNYLPTWELPSLKKYYNQSGGSMRGAFEAYIRREHKNPDLIWPQIEQIIRITMFSKEKHIANILRLYKTRNFFELIRFDFIIDDNLRVYLMEANMSPNLSSSHFKPNSLLYEQVLYSVLNMVGIGSPVKRTSLQTESADIEDMITAERNLATDLNTCSNFNCETSCNVPQCSLCLSCLSGTEYKTLHMAHREHIHRYALKRIVPQPIYGHRVAEIYNLHINLTKTNEWMTKWFQNKCNYDSSWCN